MFKILITDYQWPTLDIERSILEPLPGELIVAKTGEEEELLKLAPPVDAILTCWKKVTPRVIDAAPKCRLIVRYGIGLDNIAVDHATKLGIPVTNAPTYCLEEVAEHAIALMMSMARRITRFDKSIRGGSYPGVEFAGMRRVSGKTLGIIGFGNIGRTLAPKARGLGMKVQVADPALKSLPPEEGRVVDLDTLLATSDFISVHAPLIPATRNLIGTESLKKIKPGCFLVNTSRGGLVDLDAVLVALESGRLGGCGLDVYPTEPPDLKHPLFQHPRFIPTPHAAFYSEESAENLQHTSAGQVRDCLTGKIPTPIVNPDYVKFPSRFAT
jgi:D-3-phosphoglycerate dehydrogenase / 2-oxoglutarate reductase